MPNLGETLKSNDAQFDDRLDDTDTSMVAQHARIIAVTLRIELNNFFYLISVAIHLIRE